MGGVIGRLLFRRKDVRILMLGLDAAGKTTSLYKMKLGEIVTSIPTIGFNVETVTFKNVNLVTWDVGGRDKIRPLYRHYYSNTDALVCVIDSNDRERFDDALEETIGRTVNEDELRDVPYLILANKQDLPGAMKPEEVDEKIRERGYLKTRTWAVFGTSAVSPIDNLHDAFTWLTDALVDREKHKFVSSKMDSKPSDTPKGQASTRWLNITNIMEVIKKQIR